MCTMAAAGKSKQEQRREQNNGHLCSRPRKSRNESKKKNIFVRRKGPKVDKDQLVE